MNIIKILSSKLFNYAALLIIMIGIAIYFFYQREDILDKCEYGYNRYEHAMMEYNSPMLKEYSPFNDLAIFEYIYQYGVLHNSSDDGENAYLEAFYEQEVDEKDSDYAYIMEYYYGGFSVLDYINGHTETELCHFPNRQCEWMIDDFYQSFFRGKIYVLEKWDEDVDDYARPCRFVGM